MVNAHFNIIANASRVLEVGKYFPNLGNEGSTVVGEVAYFVGNPVRLNNYITSSSKPPRRLSFKMKKSESMFQCVYFIHEKHHLFNHTFSNPNFQQNPQKQTVSTSSIPKCFLILFYADKQNVLPA